MAAWHAPANLRRGGRAGRKSVVHWKQRQDADARREQARRSRHEPEVPASAMGFVDYVYSQSTQRAYHLTCRDHAPAPTIDLATDEDLICAHCQQRIL